MVSSIDIYWLSKNRFLYTNVEGWYGYTGPAEFNNGHVDYSAEQNPIGRYILELDKGDVSLFIVLKIIGTYCVVSILYAFRHYNIGRTYVVAASVAIAQLILLIYLYS
jgi:hypothetical protein